MKAFIQQCYEKLYEEALSQKNGLFLWSPFFLSIGIAVYFGLKFEPDLSLGLGLLGLSAALYIYLWRQTRTYEFSTRRQIYQKIGACILIISLGFCAASWRGHSAYTPMLDKALGPVNLVGTIERVEPKEQTQSGKSGGSRLILTDLEIERLAPKNTPRKVRLTARKDEGLKAGQRIEALVKLNPPSPPVSPGAFDFQRYSYFKGFGAVGFIYNQPEIIDGDTARANFWERVRESLGGRIEGQLSGREGAVANALMTGQRSSIAREDIQAMRDSGLAHLLAISGMHVGMIVGALFFFSRAFMAAIPNFALHHPIKKYAAAFALVGAILYTLVVGATIPTQRALMMTGIVLIAIMVDRTAISLRLVALAAFVVLLFTPDSLVSVSFQMSFAAVVALVAFYERYQHLWLGFYARAGIMRRAFLYLFGVILTTLVAGFATGFFSLFHFQTFALLGTIANIIAVPLMAFIVMPMLLLSYFLMPIGLEGLALQGASWGISWILASAYWTANMDGAVWRFHTFPHVYFIIMVICLWVICVWRGMVSRAAGIFFCLMLFVVIQSKQTDILISSNFDLIGIHENNGSDARRIIVSSGRAERYTAENWRRRNGQSNERENRINFPREGEVFSADNTFSCDYDACRGEIEGVKISYAKNLKGAYQDCSWADIVLSKDPIDYKRCDAFNLDRFDTWRNGAYAIYLNEGRYKIKTDQKYRGNRPWNTRHQRDSRKSAMSEQAKTD